MHHLEHQKPRFGAYMVTSTKRLVSDNLCPARGTSGTNQSTFSELTSAEENIGVRSGSALLAMCLQQRFSG